MEENDMVQSDRKTKNEFAQDANFKEKDNQSIEEPSREEYNPVSLSEETSNKRDRNTRKREFVLRIYREFGLKCEV